MKSRRIKAHLCIPIMYPWDKKISRNKKKIISNLFLKTRSNSDHSKVHNHHLVKVPQDKISQLALLFNSLTHV
jgi:hypothetical protein